ALDQRDDDLRRPRQHDVLDAKGETKHLPQYEESDDQRGRTDAAAQLGVHCTISLAGRAAMISSRRRWVRVTKLGSKDIAMVRGLGNGTTLSSMIRPGLACITHIRLAR